MNTNRILTQIDIKTLKQKHINDLYIKRHSELVNNHLYSKYNGENDSNGNGNNSNDILTKVNMSLIQDHFEFLVTNPNNKDKNETLRILKAIRKELTKTKLTNELHSLLSQATNIVYTLTNLLNDFKNSELQLESIWILNILCIYCNDNSLSLTNTSINNLLIAFLQQEKKFSNQGIKSLILEKFFCLINNLIFTDEATMDYYLSNNILNYLFINLNSTVKSFRIVCIWFLSKIYPILASNSNKYGAYINKFFDKDALFYYRFILNRIEMRKNIDEIYEFYWLINELAKIHPEVLSALFFNDKDKDNKDKDKEAEISKLLNSIVLELSLITKLIQPCIRLISNLIVVGNNTNVLNKNFAITIINTVLNYQPLMGYIKSIIIAAQTKCDIEILKDTLILLFNISCYAPNSIIPLVYNEITSLICSTISSMTIQMMTEDTNSIIKLTMNIYYRMQLYFNETQIEPNEEIKANSNKIVQCIIGNFNLIVSDRIFMLIAIDLVFIHIHLCLKINLSNEPIGAALSELNKDITLGQGTMLNINYYNEVMKVLVTYLK